MCAEEHTTTDTKTDTKTEMKTDILMKTAKTRVAIVENDPSILKAMERLLLASGYDTEIFHSAEGYLLREGEQRLDCILLDIMLDGITGLNLQKILVDAGKAPPIIFVSGHSDAPTVKQAREQGCAAFLAKPVEARALWGAIEDALQQSKAVFPRYH